MIVVNLYYEITHYILINKYIYIIINYLILDKTNNIHSTNKEQY